MLFFHYRQRSNKSYYQIQSLYILSKNGYNRVVGNIGDAVLQANEIKMRRLVTITKDGRFVMTADPSRAIGFCQN